MALPGLPGSKLHACISAADSDGLRQRLAHKRTVPLHPTAASTRRLEAVPRRMACRRRPAAAIGAAGSDEPPAHRRRVGPPERAPPPAEPDDAVHVTVRGEPLSAPVVIAIPQAVLASRDVDWLKHQVRKAVWREVSYDFPRSAFLLITTGGGVPLVYNAPLAAFDWTHEFFLDLTIQWHHWHPTYRRAHQQ